MDQFTAAAAAVPKTAAPLTADDLAALNDEIAAMARAGLPLDRGLAVLAQEMGGGRLRDVTQQLAADLRAGKPLPDALAAQGSRLPPFYAALVSAGVRSGRLGEVLTTLTSYARAMSDLRTTVVNSLIYPTIILVLGVAMIVAWIMFFGDTFGKVLRDFRLRLPWTTEKMIFVAAHPFACVVFPILAVVLAVLAARLWLGRTEAGRIRWAKMVYAIPLVGTLIRSARLAAFVELLAHLLDYRVPLPEAFRLAAAASADPLLRANRDVIAARLNAGATLAAALEDQLLIPDFLVWVIGAGERAQKLPEALRSNAALYRKRAEMRASLFRSVFPAVVIVFVAAVLLIFIAVTLLAPMMSLLEGLSGGGGGE